MCLGIALDKRGSTEVMMAHRLKEADGVCWDWHTQLTATHAPLGERVRALQSTVVSCCFSPVVDSQPAPC